MKEGVPRRPKAGPTRRASAPLAVAYMAFSHMAFAPRRSPYAPRPSARSSLRLVLAFCPLTNAPL